jgi:hypothetical protein
MTKNACKFFLLLNVHKRRICIIKKREGKGILKAVKTVEKDESCGLELQFD